MIIVFRSGLGKSVALNTKELRERRGTKIEVGSWQLAGAVGSRQEQLEIVFKNGLGKSVALNTKELREQRRTK
jgi:hypothetical protein